MSSTKERIVNAALKLFSQKGFEATSIRDVAKEAGINSATLYHYITNKEDFLTKIITSALNSITQNAENLLQQLETPEQKIAALAQLHVMYHGVHQLPSLVTDTEFRSIHGENKEKVRELREKYEMIWYGVVKEGVDTRVFNRIEDIRITTFALLSMCTGVVHWYTADGRLSIREISEYFADMVLSLLCTCKDGKKIRYSDVELPEFDESELLPKNSSWMLSE